MILEALAVFTVIMLAGAAYNVRMINVGTRRILEAVERAEPEMSAGYRFRIRPWPDPLDRNRGFCVVVEHDGCPFMAWEDADRIRRELNGGAP